MNGLRRMAGRLRNRRGATLVLVGIMMTVMVGMVGAGVDFARMYAFKAQLQVVADAGAMAGAVELLKSRNNANVPDSARTYSQQNHVNGSDTAYVATDTSGVAPGTWDFTARTFTVSSWGASNVNAVRVRALYTAPYTFGRIFGASTSALSGVAVAALGSVGSSSCLKPWAVSYQALLYTVGHDPNDTAYVLTAADIAMLSSNTTGITFKTSPADNKSSGSGSLTSGAITLPGNFYAVQFPQDYLANGTYQPYGKPDPGANVYGNNIKNNCAIAHPINVGDWLLTQTGNMNQKTSQNTKSLCTTLTNNVEVVGGEQFDGCNLPSGVTIQMAIYGAAQDKGGGTLDVQVKYIGEFAITEVGNKGAVKGYLTALSPTQGGGFVGTPGPVAKAALTL